jgi:group I intron endonuclease
MEVQSGVYKIEIAGNVYYGSSIDLQKRKMNHICKLRTGKHRNQRLQRCFDKYGEASLSFQVIVLCEKEAVLDEEQKILDANVGKDNCLNFCRHSSAPMAGIKFSDSHRMKISKSQVRNKYTFYYKCGKIESFDSLRLAGYRFGVRPAVVSRWFKRKNLGRDHGIMCRNGIIKAEITGDRSVTILPFIYREKPWKTLGISRKNYYKQRKHEKNTSSRQSVS